MDKTNSVQPTSPISLQPLLRDSPKNAALPCAKEAIENSGSWFATIISSFFNVIFSIFLLPFRLIGHLVGDKTDSTTDKVATVTTPLLRHSEKKSPTSEAGGSALLLSPLVNIGAKTASRASVNHSLAFQNPGNKYICGFITALQMILSNPELRKQFEKNIENLCSRNPNHSIYQNAHKLVFKEIPLAEKSGTRVKVDAEPIRELLVKIFREKESLRYNVLGSSPHVTATPHQVMDDLIDGLRVLALENRTPRSADYTTVTFKNIEKTSFVESLSTAIKLKGLQEMPKQLKILCSREIDGLQTAPLSINLAHTYTLQSFSVTVMDKNQEDKHYYAYVKHQDGSWWECNDESIKEKTEAEIKRILLPNKEIRAVKEDNIHVIRNFIYSRDYIE